MKFLCDEMLKGLGRWLRAAGYDVLIENDGVHDRLLLERALQEGRWLLTRDRYLLTRRRASEVVILLRSNSVDECALELAQKLPVDWLHDPFSRCLVCNTPLKEAQAIDLNEVPERSRRHVRTLYRCAGCGRLYWEGAHVHRMRRRLEGWAAGRVPPSA